MKFKKLILPVLSVIALTGCVTNPASTPTPTGNIENGMLPGGGTKLEGDVINSSLATTFKTNADRALTENNIGLSLSCENMNLSVSCPLVSVNASLSPFTARIGLENIYGSKDDFKVGFNFSGVDLSYSYLVGTPDADLEEEALASPIQGNLSLGGINVYLANDNLYVDASNTNLDDVIVMLVTAIAPYKDQLMPLIEQYLPQDMNSDTVTAMIDSLFENPSYVPAIARMFLRNYKCYYEGLDIPHPLTPLISSLSQNDAEEAAEYVTNILKGTSKLGNLLGLYSYPDGCLGLELHVDKSLLDYSGASTFLSKYGLSFSKCEIDAVALTDVNGLLSQVSLTENIMLTISNPYLTRYLGGNLTISASSSITLNVSFGSSGITFPEAYSGYGSINELVNKLMPYIEPVIEEIEDFFD